MSSKKSTGRVRKKNGCPSVEEAFAPCLQKMMETKMLMRCARKQNQKALKRMRFAFKRLGEASRHLENSTITKVVCRGQKSSETAPRHTTYRELALSLRI